MRTRELMPQRAGSILPFRCYLRASTAMSQPSTTQRERRSEPRRSAAFGFWFQRPESQRAAAWMLNLSARGAAFLADADDVPRVGERLRLTEMHSAAPAVREAAEVLPAFARVLRVDDPDAPTRRVAVQLEADVTGRSAFRPNDQVTAWRSAPRAHTREGPVPVFDPPTRGGPTREPFAALPPSGLGRQA
jgi:hypothetical protein